MRRVGRTAPWLGIDTSDCPVAVRPSVFHNDGADGLNRFLAGTGTATGRSEAVGGRSVPLRSFPGRVLMAAVTAESTA
jgi:hypothetical protein